MQKDKSKKLSGQILALIFCACFAGAVLLAAGILQLAFYLADREKIWRPDYDMVDLSEVLEKEELSDDDYALLFEQTGLTRIGVDRALAMGTAGKTRILTVQKNYFKEFEVINDKFAPYICTDRLNGTAQAIYLETGDIVVTSSTHLSGWRMGHAGLVTDGASGSVLQAMAYGTPTYIGKITDFTSRINFMIFSVRTDSETKENAAAYGASLVGTPYDATTGVFTNKNKIEKTQCAHIVWYSYKQFGVDLDSDGGLIVTPNDIARSPEVELVQVFGFDPAKLW